MTRAKDSGGATTFNTSISYRLPFHISPYATVSTARFLDLGQGGEIDYSEIQTHTWIQPSSLYEGGAKVSALDNKIYGSFAFFRQKHSSYNSNDGQIDYFRTKGVEAELRAAINRKFSLTGAYTWQDPEQLNIPFLLGIPPSALGLDAATGIRRALYRRCQYLRDQGSGQSRRPAPGCRQRFRNLHSETKLRSDSRHDLGAEGAGRVRYARGAAFLCRLAGLGVLRYKKYYGHLAVNNLGDSHYFTSQFLFWDVFVKPSELRTLSLTVPTLLRLHCGGCKSTTPRFSPNSRVS